MPKSHRLAVLALVAIAVIPAGTVVGLSAQLLTRDQPKEEQSYNHIRSSRRRHKHSEQEARVELRRLARAKRRVRLQRSDVRGTFNHLESEYGIDEQTAKALAGAVQRNKQQIGSLIRKLSTAETVSSAMIGILRPAVLASVHIPRDRRAIDRVITTHRQLLPTILQSLAELPDLEEGLRREHEELVAEHSDIQKEQTLARRRLHASAGGFAENQRIVEEVLQSIRDLQGELERYDLRLKRSAERRLIEKGLLKPKEGAYTSGGIDFEGDGRITWPVRGAISAGFKEPSYVGVFGVQHYGIDIVVPQGTPVHSAADGIVFKVRDGGLYGYSYVLVGHRSGLATLYGHLSQIAVTEGQQIRRGHLVGMSGGTPGTYGAGPMTTGAHLHFEMIENGVHIDARSRLE